MLSEYITLLGFKIYTYGLFVILGIILSSYVIWREARKEGFDEEQIFDMILIVIISGVFTGRITYALSNYTSFGNILLHVISFWTYGIDIVGAVVGALICGYLWNKSRKWSLYRIMDIFAMGISLGVPVFLLSFVLIEQRFEFLVAFGLLLFIHIVLRRLRSRGIVFGSLFGIFLMVYAFSVAVLFESNKNLLFYSFLFTLGLVILVYRIRSKKVKFASPISKDFLKNVRDLLTRKEKELAKEELLLKKEDAANIKSRDLHSEEADDAFVDSEHEKTDILTKSIEEMRMQVKKALAKINIGTYGICEVCHKPIDSARLKVFPQATTCVVCSEKE